MSVLRSIRQRLGWKLFISYLIVILAGVVVLAIAAELAIPRSFNRHMSSMEEMMSGGMQMDLGADLFGSFRAAVNESLLIAASAAFLVAILVSLFVSRRVVEPVRAMTRASQRVARGEYRERVTIPGSHDPEEMDELAQLAVSFNQMADKLDNIETMRRQLIGNVAHELRTPLTTIQGSMEALIDGVVEPGPETFHQVYLEANRLQRLVGDLQQLSQVEAGEYSLERSEVGVTQLIEAAIMRMQHQFDEKGVQLSSEIAFPLPPVYADADRIGQVLLNLIGNALQYTSDGGNTRVAAKRLDSEIQFSVADTGIGISPEHLPHIFDRFYRVDKSRSRVGGGSGVGLTIAKHLVEAHGGRIWAESGGEGSGSIFRFTLPIGGKAN
jgi:histidine kinase